jgi:hypothetical protein
MSEHDPRDDYDDEPWRGRDTPENVIKRSSDLLWTSGMFQMGVSSFGAALPIGLFIERTIEGRPILKSDVKEGIILVAVALVGIGISAVVLRGAAAMRGYRLHSLAVAAGVLSMFSLPCLYAVPFSTPIGIWALILLHRPDVRARFEAVARLGPDRDSISTELPKRT